MEIMRLLVMGLEEDCLYDLPMPKSIPGPGGCPVGFALNAYDQCFPSHEGACPDRY